MAERIINPKIFEEPLRKTGFTITYCPNFTEKLGAALLKEAIVSMGNISTDPSKISSTGGGYPCIDGAVIDKNRSGIYVFHSLGLYLPKALIFAIENKLVKGGIVGGRKETYEYGDNQTILDSAGIDFIQPLKEAEQSFVVAAIPREKTIFYSYQYT